MRMMRYLLAYSSVTGNTKAVAEAIHQILPPGTDMCPVRQAPDPDGYDFLALGFWTHRAGPDPLMSRYMEKVRGKIVGIFGTLAAYPDSEHAGRVIAAARARLEGNRIVGSFLCQGRLAPKRFERRMGAEGGDANHPMTMERRARLLEAAKHPDARDFAMAQAAFLDFMRVL